MMIGLSALSHEAAKACAKTMYNDPGVCAALDEGYAQGGYAEAMKRGAEALIARIPEGFTLPSDTAIYYALAGDKDKAVEWLEKDLEPHDPVLPISGSYPSLTTFIPTRASRTSCGRCACQPPPGNRIERHAMLPLPRR